jgi:hypothetical protein
VSDCRMGRYSPASTTPERCCNRLPDRAVHTVDSLGPGTHVATPAPRGDWQRARDEAPRKALELWPCGDHRRGPRENSATGWPERGPAGERCDPSEIREGAPGINALGGSGGERRPLPARETARPGPSWLGERFPRAARGVGPPAVGRPGIGGGAGCGRRRARRGRAHEMGLPSGSTHAVATDPPKFAKSPGEY